MLHGAQIQNIRRPALRPVEPEVQGVWAVPYAAALHNSVEDIHEVQQLPTFATALLSMPCSLRLLHVLNNCMLCTVWGSASAFCVLQILCRQACHVAGSI